MKEIKMVDLKGQYEKIKNEIDRDILNVLDSTAYINGPAVNNFQKNLEEYLKVKHVIPCANGTDALQVALMSLDLKPGDEVITTAFTFVATVEVIALLNLKPIFVDVYDDTFNISIEEIKKAITPKTKVIIPVHLFGQNVKMKELLDLAKQNNIYVVEDACQSIGCDYKFPDGTVKKSGTMGLIGCTSFFPSKNLGCYGDGGAIFTNDDDLAKRMRGVVNHGMEVRYYHDYVGVNSRLDSIQAAILNIKLKKLDEYSGARLDAAKYYNEKLSQSSKITVPTWIEESNHVFHQYTLKLNGVNRDELIKYLNGKGIPAMIYYPVPLHLQKAYEYLGFKNGMLPVTEKLSECVMSLPIHTELDKDQLEYITSSILEYVK